jgi:serine phosphatase RsbU (regulator of sigma subunit)
MGKRKAGARPRKSGAGVAKTVIRDLRSKELRRSLRQDLGDFYRFYIDEEKRRRLARKPRIVRGAYLAVWLLRGLILNLSPIRRLILLLAFVLAYIGKLDIDFGGHKFLLGTTVVQLGRIDVTLNLTLAAFLLLLLILAMELKDKLLARDELKVGRLVQLALLPRDSPGLPGWDIWLYSRPANEVCGDMVDYITPGSGGLGLTLADVSGKGLGAALLMAKLQATQRALFDFSGSPPEVASRLNRILWRDIPRGSFATLVYLEIKPESGLVRVLNAGHMPPTIVRPTRVDQLEPVALPIGLIESPVYVEQEAELAAGDTLVVYSDGLTEARNHAGELYGEGRLAEILPQIRGLSAPEAGTRLVSEAEGFMGEERPSDDLSILVLRRTGETG